jgi:hypothetical protein
LFARTSWILISGATVALAAGCAAPATTSAGGAASAPATTAPGTPAASATSAAPSATTTTAPRTAATAASVGCPVGATTLLAALPGTDVYADLAPTKTLTDVDCYAGYALALTHPTKADNATVVFRYTGGKWHPVNGGTSAYCDGVVPADVRKHLDGCR